MKQKNRVPLFVEPLEDRWVPATVRLFSSGLFISNPSIVGGSSSIAITATANNVFNVSDQGHNNGTYTEAGNIYIIGSNAKETITFNLGTNSYAGNLFINTGNGQDTVNVTGGTGSVIAGNTTILAGNGHDTVTLAVGTVAGAVEVTSTEGTDSVTLGNGTDTFAGNVTIVDSQSTAIGTGADVFAGSVSVTNPLVNTPMTVTTGTGSIIDGDLTVYGGNGADTVTLASATVNGSVNVTLGSGNNTFNNTAATTVSGNFNLQQGSGNDTVATIAAGTSFQGNAAFTFGDGNNSFAPVTTFSVGGNLTYRAGNGTNSVPGLNATVNGSEIWQLGNGMDTVTIGNAPGGLLNWRSGNANDAVTLGDAANVPSVWNVNMHFGTLSDTITLAGNGTVATPNALTGFIDMGGPTGGNVFDSTNSLGAGTWVVFSPFTLQNA